MNQDPAAIDWSPTTAQWVGLAAGLVIGGTTLVRDGLSPASKAAFVVAYAVACGVSSPACAASCATGGSPSSPPTRWRWRPSPASGWSKVNPARPPSTACGWPAPAPGGSRLAELPERPDRHRAWLAGDRSCRSTDNLRRCDPELGWWATDPVVLPPTSPSRGTWPSYDRCREVHHVWRAAAARLVAGHRTATAAS